MKKKKKKIPFVLILTAWLFPKVEKIAPWLAKRWFVHIFFSTARYPLPPPEKELIHSARKDQLQFGDKRIQLYEWGKGKPVLFVHGWMGRAAQFRKFVPVFNEAGYRVVSFDATGHGLSQGKRSHLMQFAEIIRLLNIRYGEFEMVIGHSLGGVASLHAIKDHSVSSRLVMLASPAIAQEIVHEFEKKIGASAMCEPYFQDYVFNTYGKRFEEYSASHIIPGVKNVDIMLIYDEDDKEVSMKNPQVLREKYPAAKLIITQGLGHTRILKDTEVIRNTLDFLQSAKTKALA